MKALTAVNYFQFSLFVPNPHTTAAIIYDNNFFIINVPKYHLPGDKLNSHDRTLVKSA